MGDKSVSWPRVIAGEREISGTKGTRTAYKVREGAEQRHRRSHVLGSNTPGCIQEAVVNGNGNHKKKRRKLFIYGGIGLAIVLLIAIGVFAATRGGTKIDPSKLAKVEKGDLAKSVVATGKVTPITKV